jgi:hypothetical protein
MKAFPVTVSVNWDEGLGVPSKTLVGPDPHPRTSPQQIKSNPNIKSHLVSFRREPLREPVIKTTPTKANPRFQKAK